MKEEFKIQTQLVRWMKRRGIFFCHVPNETRPGSFMRSKMQLGMLPGMPDILIFDPPRSIPGRGDLYGVALEVKSGGGKLGEKQKAVLARFKALSWHVLVIDNFEGGKQALLDLGY